MRKYIVLLTGIAGLFYVASTTPALAADADKGEGKKVTITGTGKCAKCALHETDSCQNVIVTEKGGKTTTYYLAKNDVSKDFHSNICKEAKKVKATGTVKEVDGKKEFTATKITVAEEK
jgi:RecG-like helicase